MMHKVWCDVEEVPYNFSRSSIKFQGHTGWKNWLFEANLSQITRPVAAIKSLRFALFFGCSGLPPKLFFYFLLQEAA